MVEIASSDHMHKLMYCKIYKQCVKLLMTTYIKKLVYAISYKHIQKKNIYRCIQMNILRGVWPNRRKMHNSIGKDIFVWVNKKKHD